MKRTFRFVPALLSASMFWVGTSAVSAPTAPNWEEKWYPVPDGVQDKIFVRFGTKDGKRYRQWGNGYDRKVKFRARVYYPGAGPHQPDPKRTFFDEDVIPLEANKTTSDTSDLTMEEEPVLDIRAEIIG